MNADAVLFTVPQAIPSSRLKLPLHSFISQMQKPVPYLPCEHQRTELWKCLHQFLYPCGSTEKKIAFSLWKAGGTQKGNKTLLNKQADPNVFHLFQRNLLCGKKRFVFHSVCEAACQLQLEAELFSFLFLTHFIMEVFRIFKSRPNSVTPISLIQQYDIRASHIPIWIYNICLSISQI